MRDNDRIGRAPLLFSKRAPSVEPRVVKHEADLASLTPLEERMVVAKKVRESSAQVKGSSDARTTGPKVDKPSSVWDTCMSDHLFAPS